MPETDLPLFSVVIPTHDRAALLPRAVASVLGQTVGDLEVIVVDDAGTGPVEVPPDPRIRVVHRTTNGGAGASRNTGADLATGRYLAFLDDDDVWVPHRLELALAGLARAPIAICWSRYDDEAPAAKRILDGDVADVILDAVTPHLGATALDRTVYVPHDERYRASEDVEWWLRQAAVAPVATVPRTGTVIRRSSAGSSSEAIAARLEDGRRVIRDHADWFRDHPRAAAMRWQRLGLTSLQVGDVPAARAALARSFRLRPGVRPFLHLVRARLAPAPATAPSGVGAATAGTGTGARTGTGTGAGSRTATGSGTETGTGSGPAGRTADRRVLQVITDDDRRGAQIFATDLAAALRERGHAVTTVALAPGRDGGGLDVAVLGPSRLAPTTLRALRREAADHDVVLAHGSTTLPACAAALVGTGVPFVYRQISDSLFWAPDRRRQTPVRLLLARAAGVVALSPHQSDVLHTHFGVPRHRLRVVPNGVPAAAFPIVEGRDRVLARRTFALPDEARVVLSISALVPEKGVDLVIDAVRDLDPSVHLLVAGDGPVRLDLERRAADLGTRVVFTGSLLDARVAYAAADVMVLASRGGDSMPATLVEAAFCGVPVVTTPVGAITEVVIDGDTGVVVPVDDLAALTGALTDLLTDPVEAHAVAVRARLRALHSFEISAVAEQWDDVVAAWARGVAG